MIFLKKAGAGLLILGVSFYAITQTITALIPGFFRWNNTSIDLIVRSLP